MSRRRVNGWCWGGGAVIALLMTGLARAGEPELDDPPERVVAYLISLPHGPWRTNERGRELVEVMRRHPQEYAVVLQQHLRVPEMRELKDRHSTLVRSVGAAIGLAQVLGPKHGATLLHLFLGAIEDRRAQLERGLALPGAAVGVGLEKASHRLDSYRDAVIQIAGEMKDDFAVPYVLTHISSVENGGTRFVMLKYLSEVAAGDPVAYERLKALMDDPASPLRRENWAYKALEALKGEANDTKETER